VSRALQIALVAAAVANAVLAAAFIAQADWAADLWPFDTSRLTNIFIGSILAAIAAPIGWIVATREYGAIRATALFPVLVLGSLAVYLLIEDGTEHLLEAVVLALVATFGVVVMRVANTVPLRDDRRAPALLRVSYAAFAALLILAGGLLVAGVDNVLPWPVEPDTGVAAGLIFLGAASSYIYGILRPMWSFVAAPLLGFLVYDLVLIVPLMDHFSAVLDEQRTSLVIYLAVLVYSGLLAAWFLLVSPRTRLFGRREATRRTPSTPGGPSFPPESQ
jgi:hypothetical protein